VHDLASQAISPALFCVEWPCRQGHAVSAGRLPQDSFVSLPGIGQTVQVMRAKGKRNTKQMSGNGTPEILKFPMSRR
jgi:hypothetical protein